MIFIATLAFCFWEALRAYLLDQHYQTHFVYLWAFFALTLSRSLRGPFRTRLSFDTGRDRSGIALLLVACFLLGISSRIGSSTGMRASLVVTLTALAVLFVRRWTLSRCLAHGLLTQMCFGIPYSAFQPVSQKLQLGVATVVGMPARLGWADYSVHGNIIRFPHYELTITTDCSGLAQLLTFSGIAALGILSTTGGRGRAVWIFVLALGLSWLSNAVRVALFVFLVGIGATWAVDDANLHAGIGFLVYMPFVIVLVAEILRRHKPIRYDDQPVVPGRHSPFWLLMPLLATHFAASHDSDSRNHAPPFFAALSTPPQHELRWRGPTEASDGARYMTPWLINARFARQDGHYFDLLYYSTSSNSHLNVHKVSSCLDSPGQSVRTPPPVEIDGRHWWRVSLDSDASPSFHAYFAFLIGGERYDDSIATQWEVFKRRLLFDDWQVQLTRVVFPGTLPDQPGDYEIEILRWLDHLTDAR